MHTPPAISVILPCHNLAAFVGGAIASLRAQSFPDFEALVIDDGSTDGTGEAALRAISGDGRFRLITSAPRGLSAARNLGLERARGAAIAFLDGDDRYEPDFLRDHHDALMRSGAPWTASALSLVWPDGQAVGHSAIHGAPAPQGQERWLPLMDACDIAALFPSAWNKLYRRDFIAQSRFREGVLYEDHPFFWELASRARRIRYLPQPLYRYRQGRAGQITAQADGRMLQHLDRLREVARIIAPTGLTRQRAALSRLATRAVEERLRMVPAPAQRARFLKEAANLFTEQGLRWDPAGAPDIAAAPATTLDPEMRLSIILANADAPHAQQTSAALTAQTLPLAEVIRVPAADFSARLAAASQARTPWVAMLRAGDRPAPDWAARMVLHARQKSALLVSLVPERDSGLAAQSGVVACDPAMMLIRREALAVLCPAKIEALAVLPEPVAMAWLSHRLCLEGGGVAALADKLMTLTPRPAYAFETLAGALQATPLTPPARAAVFAHLAQARLAETSSRALRLLLALGAGVTQRRFGLSPPPPGLALARSLRLILGQRITPRTLQTPFYATGRSNWHSLAGEAPNQAVCHARRARQHPDRIRNPHPSSARPQGPDNRITQNNASR
ncbi:MAG: glycosyltransferase family 2 protein [Rhodobacteraceae bacterium]|nr:MAG: glycosyltransferase family 2 protein [Paracoccaceae bacterium]